MVYATKLLNFTEGKYEFSYDWNGNGESTWDYMRVALVPASVTLTAGTSAPSGFGYSALPTGWIALDGGNKLNLVTAWQSKSVAINVAAGNYYMVFAWRNDNGYGSNPPAAVDNVTITRFACPYDVNDLAVDNSTITTTGATVTWTAGEATEWQVAYKKAAYAEWTILSTTFTTASAQLTGLTASTAYQVKVRVYCNSDDQGAWCDPITFPTACDVISAVGYSENFDTYTADNNVLPLCWSYINTTTYSSYQGYPKVYNYNAYSQSNSLYFYSYYSSYSNYDPQPQYAILPEMNDLTGKRITLQARGYNTSSTFKVGTMSNPTVASSFEEITNSENPAAMTTSYQEYIFDIPSTTNRYVAIMIEAANSTRTSNGVYIDDIVFTLSPTCYKPTEAHADVADANNATISWTPDARNVAGGSYSILDAEFNVVEDADNLTGTSFALTGLTPETSYTYYVRTNCFNTAENVEDVLVSFTTPADCAAPVLAADAITDITAHNATVTWTGFTSNDEYAVRYRSAAYLDGINEEFNGTSLPADWAQYSGVLDNVLAGTATLSSATSWINTSYGLGSYNWKINVYYTKNAWMVTPSVNIPANCALSFDVALTKYNDNSEPPSSNMPDANSKFIVLASNDNMSTWTVLREWNNTGSSDVLNNISNTANNFTIDLSGYEGDDVRVAFYVECASGPDCDLHIDNVTIGAAIPAGDWQTVTPNPTTTSTTLTGLTAETPYEVKVNGVCNGSEEENGSNIQSFTTTVACPNPTNLAYSNVAAHTADLTWNVNGNPTTNYVLTKNGEESNIVVTINEGVASYQLQGLNGETEYTVSVKAYCGNDDGYSQMSNNVIFTTQISCAIPTELATIDENTSSIKLHWTANNGEAAWVVAHKIEGADVFTEVPVVQSDLDGDGNYNLTGLGDGKTYTLKVRANCGETDGMSQWSGEITHATEASCATPTDITVSDVNAHGATISWTDTPVEGKNYIVMVANENMALNVDFENNSIPSNFTNDANHPWYVYTGTDCTTKAMRSSNNGINNSTSAIEVTVNVTEASTLSFDFWSRGEGSDGNDWDKSRFYIDGTIVFDYGAHDAWESYNGPITAGTHTLKWEFKKDGTQAGTGDCFYVDNIKITAGVSAFVEKDPTTATSLELDDLDPETTYYVKVKGDCGSATSPESDVVSFTTLTACNVPTGLTYDDESITAHAATLSWTENNDATAWKVVYSKTNINNSEITIDIDENDVTINGTTINYPLTGLDGETNYTVRVKSNCGGVHNDISAESNSTSFTTLPACYPVGDVITFDITAYTVTVHWSDYYNAGAYIVKQGDNVLDGTTTPSVNIDAENHTAIISGLEPEHTYTYGTFTVFANCGTEGLSADAKVPYFQTEPSCHPVTNVNITGKTTNSVTFTWQDMHTPETYIIKEGEEVLSDVTAPHSVVIDATNHTATISGLDENETYSAGTFKVFADCGSTDGPSAGVNVPAFTTPCSAVTEFPWAEDFNSLTVANSIPDCWNNEEGSTTSATYKWCYTTGTASGGCNGRGHDYTNCVRFNSFSNSNGNTNFLKSPALSLPAGQPMLLTFWYRNPAGGDFSVYISTDGGTTHETSLATGLTGVASWTKYEAIDLGDYAGQEVVIVFKGTSNYGSNDAYIYLDDVTVEPYVEKAIEANKWYAISSPVHNSGDDETMDGVINLTTGTYDLFGYTEATGYWDKPTVLEQGKGYIYRAASDVTLKFVGSPNSGDISHDLSYACTTDNDLKGFNLVGNPYPLPATCGMPCYRLTTTGTWHAELISYNVPVCEAVLVKTNGTGNHVSFTTSSAKSATNAPALAFTVSNDEYEDVAYAILDGQGDAQNSSLPKIGHLEPNAPALSIPVGGKNYAIATLGSNSKSFDMAFSGMGDYTISIDANANVNYLHLIDKLTGSDIDLLLNNSYSFRASIGDIASRFVVNLVPGGDNGNAGNFAFWNGTGWTVEGEGPLYVFDALGRKILSMDVDTQTTINKSQLPSTGVYILRLGEKTQKIVVK